MTGIAHLLREWKQSCTACGFKWLKIGRESDARCPGCSSRYVHSEEVTS